VGAGVVTGLLAGLFGIGGGAVIVPVLFEVFRILGVPDAVRMQLCIGTSMAIIVPTALRSYWAHRAKGLVISGVLRSWSLPAVVGVAVGSVAAAIAPPGVFELAFVLIAGIIAAKLLAGREDWVLAHELPGRAAMSGWGFLIGLASSLMGISGGSLGTMMLTLCGKPLHNAVATLGRDRSSDHSSRHSRLYAGWLAASGCATAVVGWLCLGDRRRLDRTDLELDCTAGCAARACLTATPARDRVWAISVGCVGALCLNSDRADALMNDD